MDPFPQFFFPVECIVAMKKKDNRVVCAPVTPVFTQTWRRTVF